MTTTFLVALLFTAAISMSLGYFLASVAMYRSVEDDLAQLDSERRALEEEREMLTRFWALDAPLDHDRVEFDLGRHRKAPGVSA